jgi:hypothetical protein
LPVPPRIEIREICVVSQGSSRSKRSVLLVVLESKPRRPLTFGSWLVDRFGPAGCVAAMSPKEVRRYVMDLATLTAKGQVTIPKAVRNALGLKGGDLVS